MTISERPVTYYSEGDRLSGTVYAREEAGPPAPGIVLCHGFTGVKELILPDYARAFAEAGFLALAFDYRGFGESEGARGRLVARRQVEDIRNSITFLGSLPEVDAGRIGLWGTSYGAANVIVKDCRSPGASRAMCHSAMLPFTAAPLGFTTFAPAGSATSTVTSSLVIPLPLTAVLITSTV